MAKLKKTWRDNKALMEYRSAEKEIYSDPSVAKLLRDLGKKSCSHPSQLVKARSVECNRDFIRRHALGSTVFLDY